jgi:hypothetical protein
MSQATAAAELLSTLAQSPDSYPQKFDVARGAVLQVAMTAAGYAAASFLDDRILTPTTRGAWLPFDRVAAEARHVRERRPLHYILHTGHVGSTLVSRLLDATGFVLGLREPLPLRTLAEACDARDAPDALLGPAQLASAVETFVSLWSRGYPTTRGVVVKATSATARVAPVLLQSRPDSRAIYLNLRAEPYLATLLAGPNSHVDLRGHGPERMRRLSSRTAAPLAPLHALTHGELAALSWAAESVTQAEVCRAFGSRVLPLDFDALLEDVPGHVRAVLDQFGLEAEAAWLSKVAAHPLLSRYSKAPDHEYSPRLRAEVLAGARRDHRVELERGLAWLERLATADPSIGGSIGELIGRAR